LCLFVVHLERCATAGKAVPAVLRKVKKIFTDFRLQGIIKCFGVFSMWLGLLAMQIIGSRSRTGRVFPAGRRWADSRPAAAGSDSIELLEGVAETTVTPFLFIRKSGTGGQEFSCRLRRKDEGLPAGDACGTGGYRAGCRSSTPLRRAGVQRVRPLPDVHRLLGPLLRALLGLQPESPVLDDAVPRLFRGSGQRIGFGRQMSSGAGYDTGEETGSRRERRRNAIEECVL